MGVFALAGSGLSMYIWLVTVWDVYHPLSSTLTSNGPSLSPASLLDLVRLRSHQPSTPSRRKGGKQSHARGESAQRERVRDSLKAVVIWLILKGLEPLFDNSLGYVLPLYNVAKVVALLVYARFRCQLSLHLFDSFVLPLGKPHTPLLDLGAFNSIVFPTVRFLLSLPFAHLVVAVKNQVNPMVENWRGGYSNERGGGGGGQEVEQDGMNRGGPPPDRVAPPVKKLSSSESPEWRRSPGSSRGGSSRSGKGSGRGSSSGNGKGEGGFTSLPVPSVGRKQSSDLAASLDGSTSARPSFDPSRAFSMLNTLPPAPRDLPSRVVSQPTFSAAAPPPSSSTPTLRPFAFIPHATPPSSMQPPDPTTKLARGVEGAAYPFTPRMPGFLNGQAEFSGLAPSSSTATHSTVEKQVDEKDERGMGTRERSSRAGENDDTVGPPAKTVSSRSRRKRADDGEEVAPRKTRTSPSKGRSKATASKDGDSSEGAKKPGPAAARATGSTNRSQAPARTAITRARRKGV